MPGHGFDQKQADEQPRAVEGHRWRSILHKAGKVGKFIGMEESRFAKRSSHAAETESNVAAFLHGPNTKDDGGPPHSSKTVPKRKPLNGAAAIGTESRPSTSGSSSRPPTATAIPPPHNTPRKKRNTQGLHVAFANTEPEIIGEGGDEAPLPAQDVSRSWRNPSSVSQPSAIALRDSGSSSRQSFGVAGPTVPDDDPRFAKSSFPRTATGLQSSDDRREITERDQAITQEPGLTDDEISIKDSERQRRAIQAPDVDDNVSNLNEPRARESTEVHQRRFSPNNDLGESAFNPLHGERIWKGLPDLPPSSPASSFNQGQSPQGLDDLYLPPMPASTSSIAERPHPHAIPSVLSPPAKPGTSPDHYNSPDREQHDMHAGPEDEDDLMDDFYIRMRHLRGVLRLAAETVRIPDEEALPRWLRAGIWWFLKGREGLESSARDGQRDSKGSSDLDPQALTLRSKQNYVNLAKAWWIVKEVQPGQLQRAKHTPQTLSIDGLDVIALDMVNEVMQANMQALAKSMKKNHSLPPESLLPQGVDTTIWIKYPVLQTGLRAILSNVDPTTLQKRTVPNEKPFFGILLSDTDRHFSYGRMFVTLEIAADLVVEDFQFPCILSILRSRSNSHAEITIVSQDGQVNLHVQSDRTKGRTWHDVHWQVRTHGFLLSLGPNVEAKVRLREEDFQTLWGIYDYDRRTEKDWETRPSEELVFEGTLDRFHHILPSVASSSFPTKPIDGCTLRLFAKYRVVPGIVDERKMYDGHRLVVMTPQSMKALSNVSKAFGHHEPILFSYLRGDDNSPALLLSRQDDGWKQKAPMVITFQNTLQRTDLLSLMDGTYINSLEVASAEIPLDSFGLSSAADQSPSSGSRGFPVGLQWKTLRVINGGTKVEGAKVLQSNHLRVCISCSHGTITDYMNLGK